MSPHRLEQFTDGILAIAATLLVLNFAMPIAGGVESNADLVAFFGREWPKTLAFLLSFGVVFNYWRLHGAMFRGVKVVDHRTALLNLGILATAAFVPYATNLAGSYPTLPAAAVLYSVTLLIPAICGWLLIRHLAASNAYGGRTPTLAIETEKRVLVAVYIRVVGLAFAFFLPVVSYAIYWVVIVYYLAQRQVDHVDEAENIP